MDTRIVHPPDPHNPDDEVDRPKADLREHTYNVGECGPLERVSTPLDLITRLRAVMVDLDPKYLPASLYAEGDGTDADRLYANIVCDWLDRHPLGKGAEVRHSGGGLHVLFHLAPHVEFASTNDRTYWAAVARAVQCSLPSDPNAPGVTALTRPVGSINSKTGRAVTVLREGGAVTPDEVAGFARQLQQQPFRTVANILFEDDRTTPCPVCRGEGSSMGVLDRVGKCYARCGQVTVAKLLGTVMTDPSDGEAGNVPS